MQKPDTIKEYYDFLTPEMFYDIKYSKIYSIILDMYNAGEDINLITLSEKLRRSGDLDKIGGRAYLASLLKEFLSTVEVKSKAMDVYYFYLKRQFIDKTGNVLEKAFNSNSNLIDIYNDIANITADLQTKIDIEENQSEIEKIEAVRAETLDIIRGIKPRIDTPFADVNKFSFFLTGEVLTIAARPRMGKTALALTLAEHWSKNYKVYIASLEMKEEALIKRRMSYHSGESMYDIHHSEDALNKATDELIRSTNGNIIIDDRSEICYENLAGVARKAKDMGCTMMFIDFIQLLPSKITDEVAKITNAIRLVQRLAKQFDLLMIPLAQLNRDAEGSNNYQMKHLKGSGAIEEASNHIWFLDRPEVSSPDKSITVKGDTIPPEGIAKLMTIKNKNGASDMLTWLIYNKEAMKFENYLSTSQWESRGGEITSNF
jgi:replicative DNA helicase